MITHFPEICALEKGSIKRGPFGSSITKSMFVAKAENTYKVYEQGNAIRKSIEYGEYWLCDKDFERLEGFAVKTGDIIVSCAGTIGETFVIPKNSPEGVINQALLRLTLNPRVIDEQYFLLMFKSLVDTLRANAVGSAIKNLASIKFLKYETPFLLPPLNEQRRIVSKVKELTDKVEKYGVAYGKLEKLNKEFPEKLRKSILQYAMQGKLVPQDPNDEPVEVLLEKIMEEKKKLYKEGKIKKKDLEESIIYKSDDNSYYEKNGDKFETIEVPCDLPDSWRWSKFGNISNLYTGNSISKSIKESKYTNLKEGYPYIATKDIISRNIIDYDNGIRIPFNKENFRFSTPNSILLCIEGGSAGKKMAINKRTVCFGNKLCNFSTYGIDHRWLFAYIQSPEFSSNFGTNISGIIGGVGISKLKDMLVPIAPSNEINIIIQLTDLLFERLSQLD